MKLSTLARMEEALDAILGGRDTTRLLHQQHTALSSKPNLLSGAASIFPGYYYFHSGVKGNLLGYPDQAADFTPAYDVFEEVRQLREENENLREMNALLQKMNDTMEEAIKTYQALVAEVDEANTINAATVEGFLLRQRNLAAAAKK